MSNQNREDERAQSQNQQHASQANTSEGSNKVNPSGQAGQKTNEGNQNQQGSGMNNPAGGEFQGSERNLSGQGNLMENQKPLNPSQTEAHHNPDMGKREGSGQNQGFGSSTNVQGSGTASTQNPQSSADDRSMNLGSTRKSSGLDDAE